MSIDNCFYYEFMGKKIDFSIERDIKNGDTLIVDIYNERLATPKKKYQGVPIGVIRQQNCSNTYFIDFVKKIKFDSVEKMDTPVIVNSPRVPASSHNITVSDVFFAGGLPVIVGKLLTNVSGLEGEMLRFYLNRNPKSKVVWELD